MPVITDIKRQVKRDSFFSIYVDDKFSFSLSDLDLSASPLRVGTQLSEQEVIQWQSEAGQTKVYNLALRYLSIRLRSKAEIERYLKRKEYDVSDIDTTIERLETMGLLNDVEFAGAWIRDRRLLRPRSEQALRFELMKLGVARDDIQIALAEDPVDPVATVMELIVRRRRQYPDETKLIAYLARQGFRYDQIKQALARLLEESDQNELSEH